MVKGPREVIILSDGIRGHENQSRGVALWISRLAGAGIRELDVPRLSGIRRFWTLKVRARALSIANGPSARKWLLENGGLSLLQEADRTAEGEYAKGNERLFLSTGSTAAPFSLALARCLGGKAATVMTPSVLGTEPFDFAVIPAHDFPAEAPNVFCTLGAPNAVDEGCLKQEADRLFEKFPPSSETRWGILVGGNDANYRVTPDWASRTVGFLAQKALELHADLYVTTSRRTPAETEDALLELSGKFPVFRMLLLASKESANPVPGILGGCKEVFCTEDSVSMVSEAATAGFRVRLLRVERTRGLRPRLQRSVSLLVKSGLLPCRFLRGAPRFDAMLEGFRARSLVTETFPWDERIPEESFSRPPSFNEARDAASWILQRWDRKEGRLS